jgi:hypothetical protein
MTKLSECEKRLRRNARKYGKVPTFRPTYKKGWVDALRWMHKCTSKYGLKFIFITEQLKLRKNEKG